MPEIADRVYNILVTNLGAPEHVRSEFLYHWGTPEFRFGGLLGLGGKFWYPHFRVSCYPEDSTPGLQVLIKEANRLLGELKDVNTKG